MTNSAATIRIGVLDSDAPKAWALPWKLVCSESGLPSCFSTCWMALDRLPDRGAGLQIERDRHRRELALMVDDERRDLHDAVDQRGERHLLAGR